MHSYFIAILLLNLAITIIFFINIDRISNYLKIYDIPDLIRKKHLIKTPTLGGVVIFLSITIFFLSYFIDQTILQETFHIFDKKKILIFIFFFTSIFLLGLFDDKYNIDAIPKLLISLSLCFIFLKFNNINLEFIKFNSISYLAKIGNFSFLLTIIIYISYLNACNMMDGINSNFIIYAVLILIFLFFKTYLPFNLFILSTLFFIFYFNFKNKIFLGDSGVYLLSITFGYFFLAGYKNEIFTGEELLFIILIPYLELLRLFISRMIKGKSPFQGDREHLHHILLDYTGNSLKSSITINFIIFLPLIIFYYYSKLFILLILFEILIYFFIVFFLPRKVLVK